MKQGEEDVQKQLERHALELQSAKIQGSNSVVVRGKRNSVVASSKEPQCVHSPHLRSHWIDKL